MPFDALLNPERVELVEAALDRDAVIRLAARLLARAVDGHGLPQGDLAERLHERERLASTGLGHGVAIPHGRCGALDHPRGAFLRLAAPIDFDAPDGRPVDLVFAMVVPEQAVAGHLAQLAEIAERFSDAGFRDALRSAGDQRELARLLLQEPA
jgi:PTS system nitrogen regulatory IIA component